MVVVGADVHKRTHTFVAVNEVGKSLGEKVVSATRSGHHEALRWARERFGAEVCLKRRLARVVFHHLHTDHKTRNQPCQPAAA